MVWNRSILSQDGYLQIQLGRSEHAEHESLHLGRGHTARVGQRLHELEVTEDVLRVLGVRYAHPIDHRRVARGGMGVGMGRRGERRAMGGPLS